MADPQPPRISDQPRPGFYTLRLVRRGPWVGAEIIQHEDGRWSVMLDGDVQGPSEDPWRLSFMEKVHYGGHYSTREEVQYRIGLRRWAMLYAPRHPAANPKRSLDPGEQDVVF